jgi:hypothetical protein
VSKKEPRYDIKRGRHRKHASRETQVWNTEHLIPPCPPWLSQETYVKLIALRNKQEVEGL